MQAIYEPRGKAREYAGLAVNLFDGCAHGCTYCYVPGIRRIPRDDHLKVSARVGILDAIEKDARKMQGDPRHVLLCFMCDPYPPYDQGQDSYTREAIKILKRYKMRVAVLTKGGLFATRDFDLLTPQDKFGCTLTFVLKEDSLKWEPHAALPLERFEALKIAHAKGIPTWASLEPVIDTIQTLSTIYETHEFVDEYKVGKLNYLHSDIDWRVFCVNLAHQFNNFGCAYYIKEDLLPFWPRNMPRSYQAKPLSGVKSC